MTVSSDYSIGLTLQLNEGFAMRIFEANTIYYSLSRAVGTPDWIGRIRLRAEDGCSRSVLSYVEPAHTSHLYNKSESGKA